MSTLTKEQAIQVSKQFRKDLDDTIRDLESVIMRQGMVLKAIGNPTPYPESKNPASPVVEPTADGLKL